MKDLKISKELLSEVLGISTILMNPILEPENKIGYLIYGNQNTPQEVRNNHKQINIYEFIFKCKEWAMNKGYQIISGLSDEPAYREQDEKAYAKLLWYEGDDIHREYKDMYFMANTEIEAVIKASEYVLKEISEKDNSI